MAFEKGYLLESVTAYNNDGCWLRPPHGGLRPNRPFAQEGGENPVAALRKQKAFSECVGAGSATAERYETARS